jgi:hypothetical protein
MTLTRSWIRRVAAALSVLATTALATAGDNYQAPEVEDGVPYVGIALAGLSLIAVLFAAFHNPKRSHLEDE